MAQLQFEITHQHIKRIDNFLPVAKSKNYLYAKFTFLTEEWENVTATAIFRNDTDSYEVILDMNQECLVPWEILDTENKYFYVSVYAGDLITADQSRVYIEKTGYSEDSGSSVEPTSDVYQQLLEQYDTLRNYIDTKIDNLDGGLFTGWS